MNYLDEPISISLKDDHWRASAILAGLRKGVNDDQRSSSRDRGEFKNILNDIQGVIGELVSVTTIENIESGIDYIRHNPIDFGSHVDDVDVTFSYRGKEYDVESKCLLIEDRKRLFLINKRAHGRSEERGASGYIPVLSIEGGREALVGSFTRASEISEWDEWDLGHNDTALGVRLSNYCPEKWECTEEEVRGRLEPQRGHYGTVEGKYLTIAQRAANHTQYYEEELPPLEGLSSDQMINALLEVPAP